MVMPRIFLTPAWCHALSITLTTPENNGLFAYLSLPHFPCTMSSTKKDKAISQVMLFIYTLGQCSFCR